MKFKIGDKVRVINKEDEYYDQVGVITGKDISCWYDWKVTFNSGRSFYDEDELIKEKNMFNVGDVIVSKDGSKRKVLAVVDELTALSNTTNFNYFNDWYTKKELEDYVFKLASEEETTLSMQEVADKFGVDVDKLKIKKDK